MSCSKLRHFDRGGPTSHRLDQITQIRPCVPPSNIPNLFLSFSFPRLVSLPLPSTEMASSPFDMSSEFETGSSSDAFLASSRLPTSRNHEFLPVPDASQTNVRTFDRFYPSPETPLSRSQPVPMYSNPSVRPPIHSYWLLISVKASHDAPGSSVPTSGLVRPSQRLFKCYIR